MPDTAPRSTKKNRPAYDGFMFDVQAFIISPQTRVLTPRQIGELFEDIEAALASGDIAFLRRWKFIGKLLRRPVGRPTLSVAKRRQILERDEYRCRHCGTSDQLEVDHIVPVVWGGTHDDDNLQALCAPCNRRKGPKPHAPRPEGRP